MYSTEGTSTMKPGLIVVDMQIRFEQDMNIVKR